MNIQELINQKLASERREKTDQKAWYASSLGKCLAGVYLDRIGVEPDSDYDERTLRVFSVGKMLEQWVCGLIKEQAGDKYAEQVRVEWPEMNLHGYVDLVLDGEVVEIKSVNSKKFWYIDKKGEGADIAHKMQIWIYMKLLGIPKGKIILISRDDLAIREFGISLNDSAGKQAVLELEILNDALKTGIAPPVPPPTAWQSKYCRFHSKCVQYTGKKVPLPIKTNA